MAKKLKRNDVYRKEMNHRIAIIKNFANKMGYRTYEEEYPHCVNDRPCYSISLVGTHDSEGNAYCWVWYRDTYEEL